MYAIRFPDGTSTSTESTEPVPGLHVYHLPDHVEADDPARWRIGHHDGQVIAAAATQDAATTGVRAIADLTDWTASRMTVHDTVTGEQLADLWSRLRRNRCWPLGYTPTA